jgi:hypothetical protein
MAGYGGAVGARAQGWYLDPYGIHGQRWISDGHPTVLVRDQGLESRDEPPAGEPPIPEGEWQAAAEPGAWPDWDADRSLWQRPWMQMLLVVLGIATEMLIIRIVAALAIGTR